MRQILSETQGSLIRSVVRAGVVLVTAFGLHLSAEQVAAVQLATESLIQAAVRWNSQP